MVGFLLGGLFLSVSVDLERETNLAPDDSRWIGNWWLGSIILLVASLLLFPWMSGFPRVLAGAPKYGEEPNENNPKNMEVLGLIISVENWIFSGLKKCNTPTYQKSYVTWTTRIWNIQYTTLNLLYQ